jgi:hypothetical protein
MKVKQCLMVQDDIDKLQIKATAGSLVLSGSLNASFTFQNHTLCNSTTMPLVPLLKSVSSRPIAPTILSVSPNQLMARKNYCQDKKYGQKIKPGVLHV